MSELEGGGALTMSSIVSMLHGIREGFSIDIWIALTKDGILIKERSPIDNKIRTLKTCYSIEAVKQFLVDLITCEEVFCRE